MPTYTTTYSLGKPVVGADEDAWGDTLNASLDSIDDILDGTTPVTGIDINSGTLDGVTIGGTTAGAGTFTTLTANTSITGTLATAAQPNITSVGTLTGLTVSGSTSLAGASTSADITFGDNDKAIFGAGSDLQIYHDGGNSVITNSTGNLIIRDSVGGNILIQGLQNQPSVDAIANGAVNLYYSGNPKLATTSTGIDVTGTVTADGLTVDGFADISNYAAIGDGFISGVTASTLTYQADDHNFKNAANNKSFLTIDGATGDISFYEDTGTTAKFFWDASAESLGIGTSSPSYPLDVEDSSGGFIKASFVSTGTSHSSITFDNTGSTTNSVRVGSNNNDFYVRTSGTERMRIDSSGNVGIGTSSPQDPLHVAGDVRMDNAGYIVSEDNAGGGVRMLGINGSNVAYVGPIDSGPTGTIYNASSSSVAASFYTSGTERMRIDSSGILLVGKTAADIAAVGHQFLSDGSGDYAAHTSDGTRALLLNRKTSDGEIIDLRKDGTTVGSIGVGASNDIYIGTVDTGLLTASSDYVLPWNPSTNALRDNAIDLGNSLARFKDLYLSGGVYLGGTGAANKLTDYEEGTWTPVLTSTGGGSRSGGVAGGKYTKIGNMVTISFHVTNYSYSGGSSDLLITGLPFTPVEQNNRPYRGGNVVFYKHDIAADVIQIVPEVSDVNSGQIVFRTIRDNTTWSSVEVENGSNLYVEGSMFYYV